MAGRSGRLGAAFLGALLNAQPMGFYAPHTLIRDARRHGVEVLGADGQPVSLKDTDDEVFRAAEELGINISSRFESSSIDEI